MKGWPSTFVFFNAKQITVANSWIRVLGPYLLWIIPTLKWFYDILLLTIFIKIKDKMLTDLIRRLKAFDEFITKVLMITIDLFGVSRFT